MTEQTLSERPVYAPAADRPLSPHLQVWRWSVTMASSITHRATGIALYAGSILLTAWIASAALGEQSYEAMKAFLGSPFGLLILFGFTWAQMYHLCNGIRHLIFDAGHLLSIDHAKMSAWGVYIGSVAFTAIIWIAGFAMKG